MLVEENPTQEHHQDPNIYFYSSTRGKGVVEVALLGQESRGGLHFSSSL
jgi:hypothetical protein